MTPVLEFHEVSRYFTAKNVLGGVTFSMEREEVVGLLGRNGAGKTTLIHIAMGMLHPHKGWVRAFGLSPTQEPVAVKRRIGYVAEDQSLPGTSTIGELTAFYRRVFPSWDAALERELLDRFALSTASKIKVLSKGQARQAALICAVCHRPELLILDEPAGGLDPAARREFLETSIQLLNREGTAILFSSHHMGDVERLGGRVVLLDHGTVLLDGSIDRLREEVSIAIVPQYAIGSDVALDKVPGIIRARAVYGNWHIALACAPDAAQALLRESLGLDGIRCVTVPLEELFIELVGSERATAPV